MKRLIHNIQKLYPPLKNIKPCIHGQQKSPSDNFIRVRLMHYKCDISNI